MKYNIENEAEEILKKLTFEEVQQAAKVGIMMTLMLYGKAVKTIKEVIYQEAKKNDK